MTWVRFPSALFPQHLSMEARRLYVTGWAICDSSGRIRADLIEPAQLRWGERFSSPDRGSLREILDDMAALGFCRDVRQTADGYRFRRSTGWLS
jgi:hypothetical protein